MRRSIIFCWFLFWCSLAVAQPSEVTLVVTGEGATKEEATNNALRSAIEQAFGVFVSANTEILNDELVRDEIATVSSGNIKQFNEISSIDLPNGNKEVTLKSTVSIGKLISYAQSKGSKCEFAGATFGANLKLFEMNKKNAKAAMDNLLEQLQSISSQLYDYTLIVSDPKASGDVTFTVNVSANINTEVIGKMVYNTLLAIALTPSQAEPFFDMGVKLYRYDIYFGSPTTTLEKESKWTSSACLPRVNSIVRYFYNELDEDINNYLCPQPSILVHDNLGESYTISNSLVGTTGYAVYSYGLEYNSKPIDIVGLEQGVFNLNRYEIRTTARGRDELNRQIILLFKNAQDGDPLYKIVNTVNIPLSHLYNVSSFSLDAPSCSDNKEKLNDVRDDSTISINDGKISIGDIVARGIVFWVSPDKKTAKVVSLDELDHKPWDEAVAWSKRYGDGDWSMPTVEELQEIAKVAGKLNDTGLRGKRPLEIERYCYWTDQENGVYAYRVHLKDGKVYSEGNDERKDSRMNLTRLVKTVIIPQQ